MHISFGIIQKESRECKMNCVRQECAQLNLSQFFLLEDMIKLGGKKEI